MMIVILCIAGIEVCWCKVCQCLCNSCRVSEWFVASLCGHEGRVLPEFLDYWLNTACQWNR